MADVDLEFRVPPQDLQPYVTLFYSFRADTPLFEDVERAGNAQLRVRLTRGEGWYVFADGNLQDSNGFHVIGPTSGATRVHTEGPVEVVGMGLAPGGWAAVLGIDASTMLNRVLDAEALFGQMMIDAAGAMRAAVGHDARIALAETLVRALIAREVPGTLRFAREIDAWLADSASPELDELIARTGLSRRQIERRCNALYGGPPKMLARKYRALRAAVSLASEDEDEHPEIFESFYDQSHMIREVKQFAGATPGKLRSALTPLERETIRQRRALGGQVGPLTSET